MPVKYTSRSSFNRILIDIKGLRLEVYEAIKAWPASKPGPSIEDLAKVLNRKESSMAGRVNELKKLEVIEEAPMKLNSSGKTAMTYRALEFKEEQLEPSYGWKSNGQGLLFGGPADPFHN